MMMTTRLLIVLVAFLVAGCSGSGRTPDAHTAEKTTGHESHASASAEAAWYTCPMHPEVLQDSPGTCPKCKMDLVPYKAPETKPAVAVTHDQAGETRYKCPMHPEFVRKEPGSCGICGMDLVPFTFDPEAGKSDVPGLAVVTTDPDHARRIGIGTTPARMQSITRRIRATGRIAPDERRVTHIHTRFSGWATKLHVDFTGQRVKKGDPVLDIYSPELVAAQEEYLVAVKSGTKSAIARSARRRLELLDMTTAQIDRLTRTRTPAKSMTIYAPHAGTVIAKSVSTGHRVSPATVLYTIADLRNVWVLADAYESDLPLIRTGQRAQVDVPSVPGGVSSGRITFINPVISPHMRTAQVRIELPNANGRLFPGALVDVTISVPLGNRLVIPSNSILDSGMRRVVFVEKTPGKYEPREVKTGVRTNGLVEIASGLAKGERVVTAGTFFIDSESRLRAVASGSSEHSSH